MVTDGPTGEVNIISRTALPSALRLAGSTGSSFLTSGIDARVGTTGLLNELRCVALSVYNTPSGGSFLRSEFNRVVGLFNDNNVEATSPARVQLSSAGIELTTNATRNIRVQAGNDLNLLVPNDPLRSVRIGASIVSDAPSIFVNGTFRIPATDPTPRVFSNRYLKIFDQSGLPAYLPLFT